MSIFQGDSIIFLKKYFLKILLNVTKVKTMIYKKKSKRNLTWAVAILLAAINSSDSWWLLPVLATIGLGSLRREINKIINQLT